MIPLPKWMKDGFRKSSCPHCKKTCKKRGVYGVGIREEVGKNDEVVKSFCYEYRCPFCDKRTVFTGFPSSYEDFVNDLIEIAQIPIIEEEAVEAPPETKAGGMSDKEVEEGKKIIEETDYFEDLLSKLGILDQYPELKDKPDETNENK